MIALPNISRHTLIVVVIFILAIILGPVIAFSGLNEHFDSELNHRTKCFSCEKQFAPEDAWMGEPTKGFDDEREAVAQTGSGWLAKTI